MSHKNKLGKTLGAFDIGNTGSKQLDKARGKLGGILDATSKPKPRTLPIRPNKGRLTQSPDKGGIKEKKKSFLKKVVSGVGKIGGAPKKLGHLLGLKLKTAKSNRIGNKADKLRAAIRKSRTQRDADKNVADSFIPFVAGKGKQADKRADKSARKHEDILYKAQKFNTKVR